MKFAMQSISPTHNFDARETIRSRILRVSHAQCLRQLRLSLRDRGRPRLASRSLSASFFHSHIFPEENLYKILRSYFACPQFSGYFYSGDLNINALKKKTRENLNVFHV